MADLGELADRRRFALREVRVAVTELLGQIELEPARELNAALGGSAVEGEALEHLLRGSEEALTVAAAIRLAALERSSAADRHERVLQQRSPRMVRVDVSGRDRLDSEVLGQVAKRGVRRVSPALVRPLELDEEALAAERPSEPRGAARITNAEAHPRAAGEADEPLGELRHRLQGHRGLEGPGMPGPSGNYRVPACEAVSSRQRFP